MNLETKISFFDLLMLGDRFACIDVLSLYDISEADAELLLDWRAGRRAQHMRNARKKAERVAEMESTLGQELCRALELGDALDHLLPTYKTRAALRRAARSREKMDQALAQLIDLNLCREGSATFKLAGKALVLSVFENRVQRHTVREVTAAVGMSQTWCRRELLFLEAEGWLRSRIRPRANSYEWVRQL